MFPRIISTILISWVLFCSLTAAQPLDTLWTLSLGGTGSDAGYCVQQTSDRGFIAIGHLDYHQICLIKTDALGRVQWNHVYGNYTYGLHGDFVQQTSDNGYIMVGGAEGGVIDILLIKTDSLGAEEWNSPLFGTPPYNHAYCVRQTLDGGYIVTGYAISWSYPFTREILLLVKTNGLGIVEWERQYPQLIKGTEVLQADDGGYIESVDL